MIIRSAMPDQFAGAQYLSIHVTCIMPKLCLSTHKPIKEQNNEVKTQDCLLVSQ